MIAKPREYLCIYFIKKKQIFKIEINGINLSIYITVFSRYDDILSLFSALRSGISSSLVDLFGRFYFSWKADNPKAQVK